MNNISEIKSDIKFIILEDRIPYDWDDYDLWGCVLYDIENNKIITNQYGHGVDLNCRINSIELNDAIENNIVEISTIIDALVNSIHFSLPDLDTFSSKFSIENPLTIPVNVVKGRKFKGNGFLTYSIKKIAYNPYRFKSRYYGSKTDYTYCPVIYDAKTNTFNVVNSFNYLEFDKKWVEEIMKNIRTCIDNTVSEIRSLAHIFAYDMSYSACDSRNKKYVINEYALRPLKKMKQNVDVLNAVINYKKEQDEKNAKIESEFKQKKMVQLIEWVKNNTDKQGDEIVKLAEHIYNKKYGKNY